MEDDLAVKWIKNNSKIFVGRTIVFGRHTEGKSVIALEFGLYDFVFYNRVTGKEILRFQLGF